jgi:hypothetical protein
MVPTLYFFALTKLIASSERRSQRWPSENLGWRKIMIKHITIGVTALAFGVALASVPASAQTHYGKAANDGGLVDDYNSNGTPAKPLYNSATPAALWQGSQRRWHNRRAERGATRRDESADQDGSAANPAALWQALE